MMAAKLRSTTLKQAADGGWRVSIAIADNDDMELAQEALSSEVVVARLSENPSLTELHRAALLRTRAIIDECIAALAPRPSVG
jgi:hypothetical protein